MTIFPTSSSVIAASKKAIRNIEISETSENSENGKNSKNEKKCENLGTNLVYFDALSPSKNNLYWRYLTQKMRSMSFT